MDILNAGTCENEVSICETSFNSPIFDQEGTPSPEQQLMTKPMVDLEWISSEDDGLKIENSTCKIKLPEFPIDRPWLPQKALKIIGKIRKGQISENELITLMESVADQATTHFKLQSGKFVALTFFGQIVEVSDTRVGLLKKIQGSRFEEEIFVWRVGSNSFSGRT